ncbi:hypothetical protein MAPG_10395 [Magnaporthiopsis poae ATCC 64411]|uniref:Uncharacterized protein n=1 Tax=Magnaporthiopsis poae (strain ATCC 64411 / 73-15) TaxID=644358 RepID=A0A0C4ECH1_MAGP6|nr:hypothetical protein MAPG_10395 [Magnaporthiopsis poae ATCC 64411]
MVVGVGVLAVVTPEALATMWALARLAKVCCIGRGTRQYVGVISKTQEMNNMLIDSDV